VVCALVSTSLLSVYVVVNSVVSVSILYSYWMFIWLVMLKLLEQTVVVTRRETSLMLSSRVLYLLAVNILNCVVLS
jgi:hypothetical protein